MDEPGVEGNVVEPRPSKAAMRELQRQLDRRDGQLNDARAEVAGFAQAAEQLKGRLDRLDPEAKALAECASALEHLDKTLRERQRGNMGSAWSTTTPVFGPEQSPIGRILLHLAARFGVSFERVERPVPQTDVAWELEQLANRLRG